MPKYTAKSYLLHEGRVVKTGEEIELTAEQAERLGDKVGVGAGDGEQALEDKTVAELRDVAQAYDIPNYGELKKGELVDAIKARQ